MRADNEKELEMNEYEKMVSELIEEKEKGNFNFENWFSNSLMVLVTIVIGILTLFSIKTRVVFEIIFVLAILGTFFSAFLALVFTFIVGFFLKIKRKINLKNDREYQLAKEVIRNYQKKAFEFNKKKFFENKRKNCKEVLDKEIEKSERISKLESYLKNERKRNEEE